MIPDCCQLFVTGNLATKVLCLSLRAVPSEVLSHNNHDLHLLSDEPPGYALLKLTQNVPMSVDRWRGDVLPEDWKVEIHARVPFRTRASD